MKTIGFFGSPRSKFSTTNRYSSRFLEPLPLGWGASNGAPLRSGVALTTTDAGLRNRVRSSNLR